MKKLLGIIVLGLLLNTNAQAKHRTFDDPFYHWNRFEAKGSENHYKFQSNLREDKDVLKEIKNTKKTGLISYLLFEDDKIKVYDKDDKLIKEFDKSNLEESLTQLSEFLGEEVILIRFIDEKDNNCKKLKNYIWR